jgi:hypothetical protein
MDPLLKMIKPRETRDLIVRAVEQGWTVQKTGSGHVRLDPPQPSTLGPVFAATTSTAQGRGVLNLRSELRKRGLDC